MNGNPPLPQVCPVSLRWRVKSSEWFKFRFVEDVKLFMDREDLDDSYWNDHLGAYFELPFGYKPDRKGDGRMVTQQLIGLLENPDVFGFHGDRQRKPCVRCAVVGTGGVLSGSNKGAEIDAHDYVFRWCEIPLNANVDRTTTKVVHPDFVRYVFVNYMDTSLSLRPTTGAITVFLAIQLCDVVNIYGFGYDPRFNQHYYDHQKVPRQQADGEIKWGYHDFSEERRLWQRLHEEKIITWHNRQDQSPNTAVP
ncbi:PREDICTED: alpha-N-acetylgalactosaminide alpha-2,6-sialyltransferase 1-like [Branchiostoma belcheri]|uniref:alpha-N-acetylgalactosaminide alpha-2,6-sialyltransferase n=1 Tax=Branchiostoma belcheri TaxID=7741 RepID=A0A6P4YME3_BRABE|nr:PREDICTED: alpha-N-acetylgalactosaminide alpha-2,6-sialyltransferase 1-like [Branchiostoma belcheri]